MNKRIPSVTRLKGGRLSLGDWRVLQWISVGLAGVVIAAMWWFSWQRVEAERTLLLHNTRTQQSNLAAIVAENLTQLVDRGRYMAIAANEWFDGDRVGASARLTTMLAQDAVFIRASLFDANLQRVYTSAPAPDGDRWSERLRERVAQRPGGPHEEVQVLAGADEVRGTWQVPLLFHIPDERLGDRGWLLLMVDMGYFLRLYRNIDIGRGGAIHVLDTDGFQIAEANALGLAESTGERRSFSGDGLLHSERAAERAPFVAAVSRPLADVLTVSAWGGSRLWLMAGLLSAVLLLASWGLVRGLRRQQLLFQALSEADHDKRALIEQLEQEKGRALALASFDHLTGLHNRRMFNELVASHLELARRSRKHYALAYLDLDRFKTINDSLGHHVGDLLLRAVAERLRLHVRSADIVGRMGGDEFAILITGLDAMTDMDAIAAKLLHQLALPYTGLDGHEIQTAASMGIAFFPRDGHNVTTLCRHADSAMYLSKRAGRGRFSYYDAGLMPTDERRVTLERQLPQALSDNQFVLHYQPKVRLSDYRVTGFEALLRWQHPDYGLVTPGDFVPLAEQSGLIVPLGQWVLRAACAQLAAWRASGLGGFSVAVNVSPHQLRDPGLVQQVAALITEHGLLPGDLEIEITESCLVEPVDQAVAVLEALQRLGVVVGLDDFGSGFSSLSQIKNLPIHTLKIDRSFINDVRSSNEAGVIVTSIVTLAHNLGMRVVAEGVELKSQMVFLKTANCDEVQGYFLSRPVPADEAARLLDEPLMESAA